VTSLANGTATSTPVTGDMGNRQQAIARARLLAPTGIAQR